MQANRQARLIGSAIVALVMTITVSIAAQAQYPGSYSYGNDIYRIAQDQGYRDGYAHGADHGRQGRRYDYAGTSHYRNATNGYHSGDGSKDVYKQAYRDAFRSGYDAGYRSVRSYNGSYGNNAYSRNNPYYQNNPYYGNSPYYRNDPYYSRGRYYPHGGFGRHSGRVRIAIPFHWRR